MSRPVSLFLSVLLLLAGCSTQPDQPSAASRSVTVSEIPPWIGEGDARNWAEAALAAAVVGAQKASLPFPSDFPRVSLLRPNTAGRCDSAALGDPPIEWCTDSSTFDVHVDIMNTTLNRSTAEGFGYALLAYVHSQFKDEQNACYSGAIMKQINATPDEYAKIRELMRQMQPSNALKQYILGLDMGRSACKP